MRQLVASPWAACAQLPGHAPAATWRIIHSACVWYLRCRAARAPRAAEAVKAIQVGR